MSTCGRIPDAARPRVRFARPEDARLQIDRAIAFHEAAFGRRPLGMWPSEGSVSNQALQLIADAGLSWVATDEDILSRSLGQPMRPELLYRPYRIGATGPAALFRDHALSDRIGFHYKTWDAQAAADDFLGRVRDAGRRYAEATGGEVGIVSVILDGENAWEYYPGGGRPFLRALYGALERATDIQTVTMAEAASAPATALPDVFPGSWINSDFQIWIGHRDDHRAWDQLSAARATYRRARAAGRCGVAGSGPRGNPDRRRQRLVLVVRRRPFVGPRRRLRRAVPPPFAKRVRRARCAGSRGSCSPPTSRTGSGSRSVAAVRVPDRDPGRPRHLLSGVGRGRAAVAGQARRCDAGNRRSRRSSPGSRSACRAMRCAFS